MTPGGKEMLSQIHANWLAQGETKTFLANLSARRDDILKQAENLTDNPKSDSLDLRNKLNIAYAIRKEVLEYVQTPESITRSGR